MPNCSKFLWKSQSYIPIWWCEKLPSVEKFSFCISVLGQLGQSISSKTEIAFPASTAHKRIRFIPLSSTGACWVWEKEPDDQPLLGSVVCYTAYILFWTLKNVFCLPIGSIPKTLMRLQILSSLWFQSISVRWVFLWVSHEIFVKGV